MTRPSLYHAFGLILQSDLDLPELQRAPVGSRPDVIIKLGPVGAGISEPIGRGVLWKTAPGRFELEVPNTARYLASHGSEVVIELQPEANPDEVRTYLLGSVAGAVLQQREMFVLHAGGFVHEGRAILVCGRSGAGKSTVLQGLARRGYATMSDDLVPIGLNEAGTCIASPGYPFTRLCQDAAAHHGVGPDSPHFLIKSARKLIFAIEHFDATPRPVARVICLKSHNRDTVEVQAVDPIKACSLLSRFSYRTKFLQGMNLLAPHFEQTIRIATQAPVSLVRRLPTLAGLDPLLDKIEHLIREKSE